MSTEEKKPKGRPTMLTGELIEKAKTYLATCVDTIVETDKGTVSYVDVELPTVVGLAIYLGIHKSTIYDWMVIDENETDPKKLKLIQELSDIVNDIDSEQEKRLINKTLGGLYQPRTSNMILSKHGYSEKVQQEITNPDGNLKTIVINKYAGNDKSSTETI